MRKCEREFVRQWRRDPAHTIWEFAKVSRGEDSIFQQVKEKRVDLRAHRFNYIQDS
jgi:hypothetical protein